MEKIIIENVIVSKNRINIDFFVTDNLKQYFNPNESFFIEYSEDISTTPKGIAIIPFVTNILPLIWLTNSELIIPELDHNFYKSILVIKISY